MLDLRMEVLLAHQVHYFHHHHSAPFDVSLGDPASLVLINIDLSLDLRNKFQIVLLRMEPGINTKLLQERFILQKRTKSSTNNKMIVV